MPAIPAGQVDILVVGGYPLKLDAQKGPFMSKAGGIVRGMFKRYMNGIDPGKQPVVQYTYAVKCCALDVEKKVDADTVNQCSQYLMGEIQRLRPRVVLLLGADSLRAMGYTAGIDSYRGAVYSREVAGHQFSVVASYHPVRLMKNPGLTNVFFNDLGKAIMVCQGAMDPLEMDIRNPLTYEDIMAQLNELDQYVAERFKAGAPTVVALDTETTSLQPWREDARMIAISLSWDSDSRIGLAFPVDHQKAKLTLKQRASILDKLEQVLDERVLLVEHNAKYDEKVTRHAYGLDLSKVAWDTLLGEHLLDEDKKGNYGLKALTLDYFPGAGKYEAELHNIKNSIAEKRKEKLKIQQGRYKQALQEACVPYWESLGEDGRLEQIGKWLEDGIISTYDNRVIELEYRKQTQKQLENNVAPVLYKRSEKLITKLFSSLPDEEIPNFVLAKVKPFVPDARLSEEPTFEDIPMDVMLRYAAIDAIITLLITRKHREKVLREEQYLKNIEKNRLYRKLTCMRPITWPYRNITLPLSGLLTEMEYKGIKVDREKIRKYRDYLAVKEEEVAAEMMREVGYEFNPNANADIAKLLFEEMGLPILKRSEKTGDPSTDAEVLVDLYDEKPNPVLKLLLQYRKITKCKSTYLENWLEMSAYDGNLHAQCNLNGTATFRLSMSNPALQTVMFYVKGVDDPDGLVDKHGKPLPLNLKSIFIPDDYDLDLYDLDIANAEMRTLCAYSRDEALTEAFRNGMDLHCLTASAVSDYSYDEIMANKEDKSSPHYKLRQMAKAINFGTIYCMGPPTLVANLWKNSRIKITEDEAALYLQKFFDRYPGVAEYIARTQKFAEHFGFVHSYTGRLRRFPILAYNSKEGRRVGRQAVNARIQTTSAEIVNTNMLDVNAELLSRYERGRMLLTVHDSMVFQLPKGLDGKEVRQALDHAILENTVKKFPWLPVPWKYDVDRGPNYGMASGF
jgi:uracil-DNA glycosylase family 4